MKEIIKLFLTPSLGLALALTGTAQSIGTPDEKAEFLTSVMTDEIPLKPDQVESVFEINLEMIEGIDQARNNEEPYSVLREFSENRDDLLADILDPDQYESFEDNLPLFRQKMNERFPEN